MFDTAMPCYIVIEHLNYGANYNIFRILEKSEQLGLDMHYHVGEDLAIDAVLKAVEQVKTKKGYLTSLNPTGYVIH